MSFNWKKVSFSCRISLFSRRQSIERPVKILHCFTRSVKYEFCLPESFLDNPPCKLYFTYASRIVFSRLARTTSTNSGPHFEIQSSQDIIHGSFPILNAETQRLVVIERVHFNITSELDFVSEIVADSKCKSIWRASINSSSDGTDFRTML